MNADLITLNEVLNGGSFIHLYQEELTGCWVSFGYSAYLLSQLSDICYIATFSDKMQMPCVCITGSALRSIVNETIIPIESNDGHYRLPSTSSVDAAAYQSWVISIK